MTLLTIPDFALSALGQFCGSFKTVFVLPLLVIAVVFASVGVIKYVLSR